MARQRLDKRAWRQIALGAFTAQECEEIGDEALLRAWVEQVERIGGLLLILIQSPMPLPEDLSLDDEQRQAVELTRIAHLETWGKSAQETAVRIAAQASLGFTPEVERPPHPRGVNPQIRQQQIPDLAFRMPALSGPSTPQGRRSAYRNCGILALQQG
ncbi:MAG: hypothetical protein U5R48_08440 [Gammaproteobacteria bacterium]|nr:hypothetical protein [Gammaproteobacteria bacterium]